MGVTELVREHSTRQIPSDEPALTLADFTQSIAALEAAARVEAELAKTLTAMAAESTGAAAERRRMLAEDAKQGALAATEARDRLRVQARKWARKWAEHDDGAESQALNGAAATPAQQARV